MQIRLVLAIFALLCVRNFSAINAEIVRFPASFQPKDVNSSGIVAGTDYVDGQPIASIRRTDGSFQRLNYLYNVPNNRSFAERISDSGAVIGQSSTGLANNVEAFRWTEESGLIGLGLLPGRATTFSHGVSADGSRITGRGYSDNGAGAHAFVWSEGGGLQPLGQLNGKHIAVPYDISADGSTIVGRVTTPYRWTAENGATALAGRDALVHAVNSDGSFVVGNENVPGVSGVWPTRAVYWDGDSGPREFSLTDSHLSSYVIDVTADGALSLGWLSADDTLQSKPEAVIWRIGQPPVFLRDIWTVQGENLSMFDGYAIFPSRISDDGSFIIGTATGSGRWGEGTKFDEFTFRASLELSTVPEPSIASLIFLGGGAMAFKRRKRNEL